MMTESKTAETPNAPESKRHFVSSRMPFDFFLRPSDGGATSPRKLILLLHGYAETGKRIFDSLVPVLSTPSSADVAILAPNGPFPMPYKSKNGGGFKIGCSWYFYEPGAPDYFVDMSVAVDFVEKGLHSLGLHSIPKQIIGFSQGGYLAPILGHRLGNVSQVIGIGCESLVDEFPSGIEFRIDGIHGEKDEITSANDARASHSRLRDLGIPGDFHLLPDSEHRIDSAVQAKIREVLLP